MNNTFTLIVIENKRYSAINIFRVFIFLSSIYVILFFILRMEQYVLFTGSLLIFAILYAVMYLNILQSLEGKE
jgi:inner membrane protein